MLTERFNEKTKEFECLDADLDFIVFTGYGDTAEKAKISYFLCMPVIKSPYGIVNFSGVSA